MTSLAVRLMEIDDTQLEEFIELWVERRSQQYDRVERIGAANDKGRDVIGFLTRARHEGRWHLFQCNQDARWQTWKVRGARRTRQGVFPSLSGGHTKPCPKNMCSSHRAASSAR